MPGQIAKEELHSIRHGTVCTTANWDVVTGQILAPTLPETRDNQDFARHIEQTIATDPTVTRIFVRNNLITRCSEPLLHLIADQLGIAPSTLSVVRKQAILTNMETRRAFLSGLTQSIRLMYLPEHGSWLNQIDIIFGIINRDVVSHGQFTSKDDLIEKLNRFVTYLKQTIARPVNWT